MRSPMQMTSAGLAALLLASSPLPAASDDGVKKSIERGVSALKSLNPSAGNHKRHQTGAIALWALTLLECEVPAKDPAIQKAAADVRNGCVELVDTYSVSLAIMFLDLLGDPADTPLIQTLAVRLLGGQRAADGWSYDCPRPNLDETRRLTALVKQRNAAPYQEPPKERKPVVVTADVDAQIKLLERRPDKNDAAAATGDNSNTQFALMGLWIARRHGVPVEKALARAESRFRGTQSSDGGWGYIPGSRGHAGLESTASMTCAGLMSLAMNHGAATEAVLKANPTSKLPTDPGNDSSVKNALVALGSSIGQPTGLSSGRAKGPVLNKGYYFLWSLERVGVIYGLSTIGTRDWYAWGSEILVNSQRADGTWQGEHGPEVDTCFALLFLRRVNIATDLTAALRGRVKDPITLRGAGVGGAALLARKLNTGIVFDSPTDAGVTLPKDMDPVAAKLCDELLKAPVDQQPRIIERLKDSKGIVNTDALAVAIPRLTADAKTKARAALAERLTRMTNKTLRDKLTEEDAEVRRAAAHACMMRDDRSYVPDLIPLLDDADPIVARAAHSALKNLTKQDFGPAPDASASSRQQAVAIWKAWWEKQASK